MTGTVSVLDFLRLFGDRFAGSSWRPWRSVLAAMSGLTPEDPDLVQAVTGRTRFPAGWFGQVWAIIGRRGGKSLIAAVIVLYLAVCRVVTVQAGEVLRIAIISPTKAQGRVILNYVKGLLAVMPPLSGVAVIAETVQSLTLQNGIVIEIGTASYRFTRGYSFLAVIVDEAAFLRDEETSANPFDELLTAIEPGLATVLGSLLLVITSAYSQTGPVWETYRESWGNDNNDETLVIKGPSRTFNPTIPERVVGRALARDHAAAAAEWLSEFRTDIENFVSREALEACVLVGRFELPPGAVA